MLRPFRKDQSERDAQKEDTLKDYYKKFTILGKVGNLSNLWTTKLSYDEYSGKDKSSGPFTVETVATKLQ